MTIFGYCYNLLNNNTRYTPSPNLLRLFFHRLVKQKEHQRIEALLVYVHTPRNICVSSKHVLVFLDDGNCSELSIAVAVEGT